MPCRVTTEKEVRDANAAEGREAIAFARESVKWLEHIQRVLRLTTFDGPKRQAEKCPIGRSDRRVRGPEETWGVHLARAGRRATRITMPNPFASSGPLSPAVGGNGSSQRRNPFASSAPLVVASTTSNPVVFDGGLAGAHATAPPPTGPPPTTFAGGFAAPKTHAGVSYNRGGMYPTPPEICQPAGFGGSTLPGQHHSMGGAGHQTGGHHPMGAHQTGASTGHVPYGAPNPPVMQSGEGFGSSAGSLHGSWDGNNCGSGGGFVSGGNPASRSPGFHSPHQHTHTTPTMFVPAAITPGGGVGGGMAGVPSTMPGLPSTMPGLASSTHGMPSNTQPGMPRNVPGTVPPSPPQTTLTAVPISLRGRERYCSGGAWVGPAPEWPKPPADATVASVDTSGVLPKHLPIVNHVRRKFTALLAQAVGAKKRELETLDNRLGGMLLFLNHGEGETHLSAPVADALLHLCNAVASGDNANVNAYLLHVSTHYWEEVAYWFPALKRLTRL